MKYTFITYNNCPICESRNLKILGKRLNQTQGFSPHKKAGITVTIMHCKDCDVNFANPQPKPEDIQDHYGVAPDQYWKPEYFKIPENYMKDIISWINNNKPLNSNSVILDIGAGIGKRTKTLQNMGYKVYGIEPSKTFHKMAIDKMGIEASSYICSTIENSNFQENMFDVVIFAAVLEHLYEPKAVIGKIMKWIKPGGILFIEVPNSKWLISKIVNLTYKLRGRDYVTNLSPMHSPYHLFEFSHRSFESLSREGDFKIADYQYIVCDTLLPKIFNPILVPLMKYTNTGMDIAVLIKKK